MGQMGDMSSMSGALSSAMQAPSQLASSIPQALQAMASPLGSMSSMFGGMGGMGSGAFVPMSSTGALGTSGGLGGGSVSASMGSARGLPSVAGFSDGSKNMRGLSVLPTKWRAGGSGERDTEKNVLSHSDHSRRRRRRGSCADGQRGDDSTHDDGRCRQQHAG